MIKTKFMLLLAFSLLSLISFSQEVAPSPAMADAFRAEGKIYVVITVIALIFVSIVGFLIYLERKLNRIEKQINTSNR